MNGINNKTTNVEVFCRGQGFTKNPTWFFGLDPYCKNIIHRFELSEFTSKLKYEYWEFRIRCLYFFSPCPPWWRKRLDARSKKQEACSVKREEWREECIHSFLSETFDFLFSILNSSLLIKVFLHVLHVLHGSKSFCFCLSSVVNWFLVKKGLPKEPLIRIKFCY